jgi:capsular polysaccharide biosynthesis protein
MESTNIQIFDMASLPEEPVKPRKNLNLSIAALLGLFIGTMLTFVIEYFYKTIDTAEDLRQYAPVRVIGIIPRLDPKPRWKLGPHNVEGDSNG